MQPISPYVLPGVEIEKLSKRQRSKLKQIYPVGTLTKIEKLVCEFYEISGMLIRTKRRDRHIVWPRHVYCYLCYQNTDYSLKQIGKSINIEDHTTIRNGVLSVKDLISSDQHLKNQVLKLQSEVASFLP